MSLAGRNPDFDVDSWAIALLALQRHGAPVNTRELGALANLSPSLAAKARDRLAALGLARLDRDTRRPIGQTARIAITDKGSRVGAILSEIDALLRNP
jgi:hypothetical protein